MLALVQRDLQTGFELSADKSKAPNVYVWRGVLGTTFTQNGRVGRSWSPMVEFLAERDLVSGARTHWDIVPEMQISLNKRQHVRLNVGVRTPMNDRTGRSTTLAFYLLWDTFDGPFWEAW